MKFAAEALSEYDKRAVLNVVNNGKQYSHYVGIAMLISC
jgi:hypothetical protein